LYLSVFEQPVSKVFFSGDAAKGLMKMLALHPGYMVLTVPYRFSIVARHFKPANKL
jgi:hypothetical protein